MKHRTLVIGCGLLIAGSLSVSAEPVKVAAEVMVPLAAGRFKTAAGRELPVGAFAIGRTEVTRGLWDAVWEWAQVHDYDMRPGQGETPHHPVAAVDWFDCVKWCNALSEMQGLKPAYYVDTAHEEVYRSGEYELGPAQVDWDADGFRLPTEVEREYAHRGGTTTRYYWSDEGFSTWSKEGMFRDYAQAIVRREVHTPRPVGLLTPNAFGLYDMSGNVSEWCWDWYIPSEAMTGGHGPVTGHFRAVRGGSIALDQNLHMQSGYRACAPPQYLLHDVGFRIASGNVDTRIEAPPPGETGTAIAAARLAKQIAEWPNDTQAAAERLMGLLNLEYPGLEAVKIAWEADDAQGALDAYRDYFVMRHADAKAKIIGNPVSIDLSLAEIMELEPPLRYYDNQLHRRGTVAAIYLRPRLFQTYATEGNSEVLTQAWRLLDDFIGHSRQQYLALEDAGHGLPYIGPHFKSHWLQNLEMSCGLDGCGRASEGFKDLRFLAGKLGWSKRDLLPGHALANQLWAIVRLELDNAIIDDRAGIPNQVQHNGSVLVEFGVELPEFRAAAGWLELGSERLRKAFENGNVLPDGGDMEQSFNYNKGLIDAGASIPKLFDGVGSPPAWVAAVRNMGVARLRLYAGLIMPSGVPPSVGNHSHDLRYHGLFRGWVDKTLPDPLSSAIVDNVIDNGKRGKSVPAFTSIAFPYSGYYALRDGWRPDSHYLFFKSSRAGRGHGKPQNNAIELSAHGRHLLVASGAGVYGERFAPDHRKLETRWLSSYIHGGFAQNTVAVDGGGQSGWKAVVPAAAYSTVLPHRWLSSTRFDFAEGFHNDGYSLGYEGPDEAHEKMLREQYNDPEKYGDFADQEPAIAAMRGQPTKRIEATHHRQVIFVRSAKLYIVIDRVDGGSEYTQLWHFPPPQNFITGGFEPEQVVANVDGKSIATHDPDGANLAILHFTAAPIAYEQKYGEKFPHRGWYAMGVGGGPPAVEMRANWSGSAPLVSVLHPRAKGDSGGGIREIKPLNSEQISGFEITLDDGTQIAFQTAAEESVFDLLGVKATAKTLLVTRDAAGETSGLVLGAKTLQGGQSSKPDFEFQVRNGEILELAPIAIPRSFGWDILPAYNANTKTK